LSPSGPFGSDAYVTKLNASGSALVYSTLLGGADIDNAYSIAVDPYGNATVSGATASTDFPLKNPIQSTFQGGQPSPRSSDVFVTILNAPGSGLLFSTYLGGAGLNLGCGVALDSAGSVYVTGFTVSPASGFVDKISTPVGPSFTVSGFPSTVTAGTSGTITVTALNADGSVNTGYSGTVHFTSSDPQAVLPPDVTLTNGTGSFNVILKTAGTQSITVTDASNSSIAGSESGITVTPGAATHFLISGPSSIAANTAFSITVTAVDAYGNIATGYRGTVHFSDSVGGATLPGNYTFKASDNGVHTFTNLKLKTKGMQTITIVDVMNNSILGTFMINVT
jgi:Beta-propeller repeat